MESESATCHSCGSPSLDENESYRDLVRVSSDCRPRDPNGRLAVCGSCGLVQAICDDRWRTEIAEIYRDYDIYFQSGGREQAVFHLGTGEPEPRSVRLVRCLSEAARLEESGQLLDVGCGNGAFIRAFSRQFPSWKLNGSELSEKYRHDVEAIEGFDHFYTGDLGGIDSRFDLVSLIHVLEHIENPVSFLTQLAEMLTPEGVLFIEVPWFEENPFDLVIADHSSHFTPATLGRLAARAGFEAEVNTDWVSKELSAILRPAGGGNSPSVFHCPESGPGATSLASTPVDWLRRNRDGPWRRPPGTDSFGIFGTAIGANWLFEELRLRGDSVDFFIDEDPARVGNSHFEKPILAPDQVPAGSRVVLPLAPVVARAVDDRLSKLAIESVRPVSKNSEFQQ